MPEEDLVGLC